MIVLLGLGCSLCWGTADFFGGLQSRRLPALGVALWSQAAGAVALLLVLLATGSRPLLGSIAWGIGGGIFSGAALVLFYRGLATGVMSIVAPIAACGTLVPVAVALAMGEPLSPAIALGILVAIAGVALSSIPARDAAHPSGASQRGGILLALGAAVGFGTFNVFVARGSAAHGVAPLWSVAGARIGSLAMLLSIAALRPRSAPWPGRRAGAVAGVGVLDTTANALFAFASTLGNLGVASTLSSLYPVATVVLGRIVLAERLTGMQGIGVTLALAGVVLLSSS